MKNGSKYRLLGKVKLQFYAYLLSCKSSDKGNTKFVIFGQGRTGSSLLVNLLNSHVEIDCKNEIYNRKRHVFNGRIWFPYLFLKGMEHRKKKLVFGFKVKIYQLILHQKLNPNDFLDHLVQKGYKIIYLRRNNFLNHALSGFIAKKRKAYHLLKEEKYEPKLLEISKEELREMMLRKKQFQQQELECLNGRDYFEVIYERDLENSSSHQNTCDQLFDFLELKRVKVETVFQKVNKKKPEDILTNYSELIQYFKNTAFANFFGSSA